MNYREFYSRLFEPLTVQYGPTDPDTIVAIIGFDAGGPLNFNTIGLNSGAPFILYVSCELAVRSEQKPSAFGRYELLASCDCEQWVRSKVSDIGRMSLDHSFGHGHTVDISQRVESNDPIQGIIFMKEFDKVIDGRSFGVLRCIGITRPEMEYAQRNGSAMLFAELKKAGIFPHTKIGRPSVI